jgi:hypothetical protein
MANGEWRMANGGSRQSSVVTDLQMKYWRSSAFIGVALSVVIPLGSGAAIAQLSLDRAPLKTCDRSRETVAVIEDTTESATRLKEVGLASGISPVVQDVLRRSGCFAPDPKASLQLRMSVTGISDDPIVVNTSVRLANSEWVFEASGRGQANPQMGTKATKADAYAAALASAVEDAVNNLIEVHDRTTSH